MAVVQLSDVVVPEFYSEYMAQNSMTSTALFQSGVLVRNPLMEAQLGSGGDIINIPAWAICSRLLIPVGRTPTSATTIPRRLALPTSQPG